MKILNFGSLNLDYVYQLDHIVAPGETINSSRFSMFPGGKGMNQSVALGRAGASVCHAGNLGSDGIMLMDLCRENGVDTKHIRVVPQRTGHAIIQVAKNGQNGIVLFGGANRTITKEFVDEVLADFDAGDLILLQNEINLLDYIIERAHQKHLTIVLNPSPFDENLIKCDLAKVSIFIMNEVEGAQIAKETEPEKILAKMKEKYPDASVVLTLGEMGVVCRHKEQTYAHGIYKVNAIDTTAAGDTFTGYFLAMMASNQSVEHALEIASKAAGLTVSRAGAASSIPLLKEVMNNDLELFNDGIKAL